MLVIVLAGLLAHPGTPADGIAKDPTRVEASHTRLLPTPVRALASWLGAGRDRPGSCCSYLARYDAPMGLRLSEFAVLLGNPKGLKEENIQALGEGSSHVYFTSGCFTGRLPGPDETLFWFRISRDNKVCVPTIRLLVTPRIDRKDLMNALQGKGTEAIKDVTVVEFSVSPSFCF